MMCAARKVAQANASYNTRRVDAISQDARVVVFAGPSLPPADRPAIVGIDYRDPAKRGDVEAAAHDGHTVLLIDGVFRDALSTTPSEMYRACRRGTVYGASSMGALRASECEPYGAVPLGAIATMFARGVIEGDDEVAVLMHPQTFAALTVPVVNVRYVAWLAQRRRIIDATAAAAWVHAARTHLHYTERSWTGTIELAPPATRTALGEIARREGDLKRWDARFALRSVMRRMERHHHAA